MNKAYRNVWSEATGTFVAVAENVKARGKRSSSAKTLAKVTLAVAALGAAGAAQADVTLDGSTPVVTDGAEIIFENGAGKITFTNGGTIDFGATGGTITGLNDGAVDAASRDAVTGKQLHATNQEISGVQGSVAALQVDMSAAQNDITTLQGDLSTAQGNISTLQGDVSTAQGNISTLQGDVSTAQGNISTLQGDVSTAQGNISTLQGDVSTAKNNILTLQGDVSTANTNIADLQNDLALLQGGTTTADGYSGVKYFRVKSDGDDAQATGDDAIAIGPNANAAGAASLAAGVDSLVKGASSIAVGERATVDSEFVTNAIAIGTDAAVQGKDSSGAVALGSNSVASAANAAALGAGANASGANAVALGNAVAAGGNALAAGNGANALSPNSIALGVDAGKGTQGTLADDRTSHIAIGTGSGQNVVGNQTVALGYGAGSNVSGDQNIAVGSQAGSGVDGDLTVAIGYQANKDIGVADHAVALGALTQAGRDSVAAGYGAVASSEGAIAIGTNSNVSSGQGVALGRNANAVGASVALGTNSVATLTDAQGTGFLTGSNFNDGSVVSVGNAGQQRRIVNVADGSNNYDAVNVGQLKASQISVANLVGVTVDSTTGEYSKITVGKDINGQDIVVDTVAEGLELLGSGAVVSVLPADAVKYNAAGQINNVTAGTLATDAVNVGQMNTAIAEKGAKYYSVNSVNPTNRDNSGATGTDAIAIGPEAGATKNAGVAVGLQSRAEGNEATAIGYNSNALGNQSSVLGNTSFAYGDRSVAIGSEARSNGENSIVMGTNAQADVKVPGATVDNAIVIGTDAEVSADYGISLGFDATVNQDRGIAQGYKAAATGEDATAIGSNAHASATNAFASGTNAQASGNNSIASGTNAHGYANSGIALGDGAVSGRQVLVPDDSLQNFNSIAVGTASKATALNASALGRTAEATEEQALAIGDAAKVSGKQATGVGAGNTVSGAQAFAGGAGNTVGGAGASVVGNENSVAAAGAGAFGNDNTLTNRATNSRIVGNGNQITAANSFVVGNGNDLNVGDAFVLGNGASVANAGGVAIGSGSASTAAAGVAGYAANAGHNTLSNLNAVSATVSTAAAVAVGSDSVRRQITGVAAGTADTDAVNVAQLKSTGWNIATGNTSGTTNTTHVSSANGDIVDIGLATGENNLDVTRSTSGNTTTIAYSLKKNLDLGSAGSVKTGDTTLNNAGVQIANGGNVTNVGAGSLSVSNGSNTVTVNSSTGTVNGLTNKTFNANSFTSGQAATEDQLKQVSGDLTTLGFAIEDESGNKIQKSLGESAPIVGDGNIETAVQNGKLVVGLADNVNVSQNLTVGGNSSVAGNSSVGGTLNVAGSTTLNNTLQVAGSTTLAGGATIGNNLTVNPSTNVNFSGNQLHGVAEGTLGTDAVNVNQLNSTKQDIITEGFALKAQDGQTVQKKLGEAVDVVGGDTNVVTLVDNGQVKVKLADSVSIKDNLTVGGNSSVAGNSAVGGTLNVAGATTLAGGANISNHLTVNPNTTVNMGGNKVGGVGAGEVSSTSQEAVNGSQLFDVANRPLGFSADQGSDVSRKLGETLAINGADSNIVTKTTAANGIEIELAKNLDLGSAGSIKLGDTTVNNGGLSIVGGPSVTKTGINANGTKITNVVAGSDDTDAVNVSQLNDVKVVASKGWNLSAQGIDASNVAPGATVDLSSSDGNIDITKGAADGNVTFALADTLELGTVNVSNNLTVAGTTNLGDSTLVVNKGNVTYAPNTTINMGGNKITNVAEGTDGTDAVNKDQLDRLADTPLTFVADSGTPLDRKLGQQVAFTGSNANLSTTTTANGVEIALADDLDLNSVKTGNTLINNSGVQVGQNVHLGNTGLVIANGPSVTNSGIDAGDKIIQNVKAGVADTDGVNVSQLKGVENVANMGWNVTANGTNSTNVKPGDTVDLTDADGNIVVAKGTDTNPHQVTFGLADSVSIKDNLTVGGTLNVAGATTLAGGANISNHLTVNPNTTVNMGGNKVGGVGAGEVSSTSQEAVNGSQLFDVANRPLGFSADQGSDVSRKLGETLAINGADSNIVTKTTAANGIEIELAKNLDLGSAGSIKLGDTTVNNGGLSIVGGPSVTKTGINAGGAKITNVAAGSDDTDAVNVSQLNDVAAVANSGWNLSAEGGNQSNVAPGASVDLSSSDGNIDITKGAADGNVTFALADTLELGTVNVSNNLTVAGTTNLGDSTLVVNKGNVTYAPNTTINMGGNKITNVAEGTDGTDAVNKDQLDRLADTPLTFVADSGTPLDRKLGQQVAFTGSNANLSTTTTANGVEIALADDLDLNSVKTGNTLINNSGVQVGQNVQLGNTGLVIANGPSVTNSGIDAGDKIIQNVKAGVADTDGVNVSQLKGVENVANMGWNVTANGTNSTNVKPGDTVDLTDADGNIVVAKGTDTNPHQVTFGLSDNLNLGTVNVSNNLTVGGTTNLGNSTLIVKEGDIKVAGGTTVNMGGNKITNVAKGTDGSDAVNKDQLDELANTPLTFVAESGAPLDRKLGQQVAFTGSNANISTKTTANGVEIALADNLDLGANGSVTTGDTVVNNAGVKVGGDVTLNNTGLIIAGGPSVTTGGINAGDLQITNVAAGTENHHAVNLGQLKDVETIANTGWQLSVNGDARQDQSQVKPGDVVDFSTDDDGNIIIDKTGNNVVVKMSRDLDLDSVTTGQTVMNNDGVKVGNDVFLSSDGLRAGNVIISAATGINAGGMKITNVAAGTDLTDAVNVSQLKDVEQQVGNLDDRAVKYDGNVGDPKSKITLEGDVSTDGGKTGGTTITNVARGEISENSTDAVNGSQIKEMGDSIAEGMGGNSKFEDGKLVTELNVGGNTYNNVNDALNGVNNELNTKIDNVAEVANAGWQIDTNGEGSSKVAPGKTVNFVGGSNIEISRETTADGNNNVTVGLAKDITVDSVTATTVTADTVNAKEVVIENGPVLNQNGIDMRDQRIVNVAAGQAPNDAVNVSQLEAATGNLQNQVNSVRGDLHKLDNKLSAGVAAAMATAGLPQAYLPGKSMAAIAGGTWNGESGFAIGVSTISDNGKWVMKLSGNTSSRGDFGGAVGVGYQW
ncbi:YadA-like family protein [Kerstersia gyiorum]|uniref:YadA-like family protein n=5 Tax=Kerstersia gyiorum TaxID=206506 RepID=UPI00209D9DD9|nr:YadA-like family protein [Kerstersia gyiorum]MCP1670274.1 autotransporter adhesin [Kerstersia gyiorum]MCP1708181.1 autotransporter adhesin [Kerstersia gyiorum]